MRHALIFPNEGLFIALHNEVRDDIIHLAKQAFFHHCVHNEPIIHLGRSIFEEEVCNGWSVRETQDDMSIWGLWESQTGRIIDIRFGYAGANTWKPVRMDKLLEYWEKTNKNKHGQACYNQRRHFSPFVLSVDSMMGKEELLVLATLSQIMAAKMEEPISQITGWYNVRIKIAVVRSYSRLLCGY